MGRKEGQIAGLSGWIATHIDHPSGRTSQQNLRHRGVDAGSRRVEYNDVGLPVCGNEIGIEHILHVAGEKGRVRNAILTGIDFRIFNGFRNIFDPNNLTGQGGEEKGDRTGAGI